MGVGIFDCNFITLRVIGASDGGVILYQNHMESLNLRCGTEISSSYFCSELMSSYHCPLVI